MLELVKLLKELVHLVESVIDVGGDPSVEIPRIRRAVEAKRSVRAAIQAHMETKEWPKE